MKTSFHMLLIPISLSLLVSCGGPTIEDNVRRLVSKYNHAITFAYRDGNFDPLLKVAGGRALTRVDNTYQAYLSSSGIVMDAEILDLKFNSIVLGTGEEESAIEVKWHDDEKEWREIYVYKETLVETEERWKFKWVDRESGSPASPVMTVRYKVAYALDKVEGKMKVVTAVIKEEHVEKTEETGADWKAIAGAIPAH